MTTLTKKQRATIITVLKHQIARVKGAIKGGVYGDRVSSVNKMVKDIQDIIKVLNDK